MKYRVCPSCGAVEYGNLTCTECRRVMRTEGRASVELLDLLDAAGIPATPPCGPEDVAGLVWKLGRMDAVRVIAEAQARASADTSPAYRWALATTLLSHARWYLQHGEAAQPGRPSLCDRVDPDPQRGGGLPWTRADEDRMLAIADYHEGELAGDA